MCQVAKKFLGTKTNASYALQSHFIINSESNETKVIKNHRLSRKKVKQMRTHKVNSRKPREKKINPDIINKLEFFYLGDDISTLNNAKKNRQSRKFGPSRYMRFTFKEAYKIFRFENPEIKISFSSFYALRPGNIKALQNTPLLGCFCIYCSNVKLKLLALKISNIETVYELYNFLICEKDCPKQVYRNARCIFNECSKCSK